MPSSANTASSAVETSGSSLDASRERTSIVTVEPSLHTRTQVDVIRAFLGVEVELAAQGDGTWLATVPPRG